MDVEDKSRRFYTLFQNEKPLTKSAILGDLVAAANTAGIKILVTIACLRISNQDDPYELKGKQMDEFIDLVDPIVSAALNGTQLRQ